MAEDARALDLALRTSSWRRSAYPRKRWMSSLQTMPRRRSRRPERQTADVSSNEPKIFLPSWFPSESGLLLPSTVAPLVRAPAPALPTELQPSAAPVVVREGSRPTGLDQIAVYFAESEAGMEPSRLRHVRAHLAEVAFEPAMLGLARVAARAWAIRGDKAAQLRLAEEVFQGHAALSSMRSFMGKHENAVIIAEQHVFVVMRLLIERARDGQLEGGLADAEVPHLQAALLGATSVIERLADEDSQSDWLDHLDSAVAFFVQNGAYNRKPQPLGELARSRELYTRIARDPGMAASEHFCPLDEWMREDYGFDDDEQLSFGFALSAMTTTWANDDAAGGKSYVLGEHLDDVLLKLGWESRRAEALNLLSADRDFYRQAFQDAGDSPEQIAWELRPFMQRPFLRLTNGGLVLVSPRALASWVTDGFYYRLLDAAQKRNKTKKRKTSRAYTAFAGNLLEKYCLELAEESFDKGNPPGGGKVYGEQPYGHKGEAKTSDVAIQIGTDLVLFEVTASRLRADTLVLRDPKSVSDDLHRMVISKLKQLDGCVNALSNGKAQIPADNPEVLWEGIERVWPVVVTGGDVTQNEFIWAWIRRESKGLLDRAKIQPLTLLDIADYEALMGIVEHGHSLIKILEGKTQEAYRELELAIWIRDDPTIPRDTALRPSAVEKAFTEATTRAQEYFDLSKGLQPDRIDDRG